MKKVLTSIVLALLVIALPVGLIGCKKATAVEGIYKFDKVEVKFTDAVEATEQDKQELIAHLTSDFSFTIEVKEDKTYVVTDANSEEVDKGTWKKGEGANEYIITSEDPDLGERTLTIKNGTITMLFSLDPTYWTATITYKK